MKLGKDQVAGRSAKCAENVKHEFVHALLSHHFAPDKTGTSGCRDGLERLPKAWLCLPLCFQEVMGDSQPSREAVQEYQLGESKGHDSPDVHDDNEEYTNEYLQWKHG